MNLVELYPSSSSSSSANKNENKEICAILEQLGENQKSLGIMVKYNAYLKAVHSISSCGEKITSGAQAKKLPGVGMKIGDKIDEILSTGKLESLEKAKKDTRVQALRQLTSLHGVGPQTAKKWFSEGIETIDQVKEKCEDGSIVLNDAQKLGLKYFDAFREKIPRREMLKHENLILQTIRSLDSEIAAQVVGSFRRQKELCGDVDVLLTHPAFDRAAQERGAKPTFLADIVAALRAKDYIIEKLSHGTFKFSGVCRLAPDEKPRRIDLKLFPTTSFAAALLHFTGSGEFNRDLRGIALSQGFQLSEFGMVALGETAEKSDWLPLTSERDIFDLLGLKFVEPQDRNR